MLKKELQEWLDVLNNVTTPELIKQGFKANAINAREGLANLTKTYTTDIVPIAQIVDDIVPAKEYPVPVRIFNPDPERELPLLIHFHGGGHMAGSVTVYDPIIRKIAKASNHIVVAVEYRLSPENPYPAGIMDAYNVVKNIWPVLDERKMKYQRRLSIIGDSGGGALATTVAEKAQFDPEVKLEKQVLIYPSVDYTLTQPSIERNGNGYLLATAKIRWYFDYYFQNNEDRKAASPLYGKFSKNMPKTLIFTAEYCPLKDEGLLYAQKLREAGVMAEAHNFENMIHTFVNMEDLCKEECDLLYQKIGAFLRS